VYVFKNLINILNIKQYQLIRLKIQFSFVFKQLLLIFFLYANRI